MGKVSEVFFLFSDAESSRLAVIEMFSMSTLCMIIQEITYYAYLVKLLTPFDANIGIKIKFLLLMDNWGSCHIVLDENFEKFLHISTFTAM